MEDIGTVKGMMPKSHIDRVRRDMGEEGVRELERRYGKSLHFTNDEEVPVSEEVAIAFLAFDLLGLIPEEGETRDFAVGRFHFRNFATTPYGQLMTKEEVCHDWKHTFLHMYDTSSHVVRHERFRVDDLGEKKAGLEWFNSDFPVDYWSGWIFEWAAACGIDVRVTGKVVEPPNHYYHTIEIT